MTARIYKPARTAMQSGQANAKEWTLDYEPERAPTIEPLMGWTSTTDMKQEVHLYFDTKEEAIAFASATASRTRCSKPSRRCASACRTPTISPIRAARRGHTKASSVRLAEHSQPDKVRRAVRPSRAQLRLVRRQAAVLARRRAGAAAN